MITFNYSDMRKRNDLTDIIKFYELTSQSSDIDIRSAVIDYDCGHEKGWSEVRIDNAVKVIKLMLNYNK